MTAKQIQLLLSKMEYRGTVPPKEIIQKVFNGPLNFPMNSESTWHDKDKDGEKDTDEYYYCQLTAGQGSRKAGIECFSEARNNLTGALIAHELEHTYNAGIVNRINDGTLRAKMVSPYSQLQTDGKSFGDEKDELKILGKYDDPVFTRKFLAKSRKYVFKSWNRAGEEFANMFANWVFDGFNLENMYGITRHSWFEGRLMDDLSILLTIPPNLHPNNRCYPPII